MNRQPPSSARLLSTAARVHPPYLLHLHNASRRRSKGLKWIPPLAAVATAGYAVASYRESTSSNAQAQAQAAAAYEAERRAREALMADAYGDRGSLEELERAVRAYEAHQQAVQGRGQGGATKA